MWITTEEIHVKIMSLHSLIKLLNIIYIQHKGSLNANKYKLTLIFPINKVKPSD